MTSSGGTAAAVETPNAAAAGDLIVSADEAAAASLDDLLQRLATTRRGLVADEAARRLAAVGRNALVEEHHNPVLQFLGYFWGPIPWMIEMAAVLSGLVRHWDDLVIISVLLAFNAVVGFVQEHQAGNAIAQLKKGLAPRARALRDGSWQAIAAGELVPGDVVRIRLGDVIPADVKLFEGEYLSVDQAALTGESLPVDRKAGDVVYSGSVAKQGEMVGLAVATGMHTFFGRTAQLVGQATTVSYFQRAVLSIGDYLIYMTLGLVAVLLLVEIERGEPLLDLIQFALVLTVAAIPVAMPAVLSVTMAVGAVALSRMKAIVARLESIEEMAGMDVLCSDKTGTLTKNELTLGDPIPADGTETQALLLAAALASKREDGDPIDLAVLAGLGDPRLLTRYREERFVPFDPVSKRTQATVRVPDGGRLHVTKGAPQVVLALAAPDAALAERTNADVDRLAARGYRTLGVARSDDGEHWHFLGLLPLYDPPREDAQETIREAHEHGVSVKMVTGDNVAIAREIAGQLGLGRNILPAEELAAATPDTALEAADGWAQVFPEHKYGLVKALQARGHLVGMTGDGVNDAPALKQADVGVAVSGATDAARAAADLVLTAPGLSVIVRAVEEARRIFERMNAYAIYRITETLRIMLFMVLAMLVYDFYPITAIMIILLALLNDLPIMTIAYDRTRVDQTPVRWNMRRVLTLATVLGGIGVIETFGLLAIAHSGFDISHGQLQSLIFLKLVAAGHMTLLVARKQGAFFLRPFPAPILLGAILGTQVVAALIVGFGWFVTAIPWSWVGLVWLYVLAWVFVEDVAKMVVDRHLAHTSRRHQRFLRLVRHPFAHPAASA